MTILHITYDLRDRLKKEKTTAVKNLIKLTSNFAQIKILDLVRVPFFNEEKVEHFNDDHIAIDSFGLPYGVFLIGTLKRALKHILMNSDLINLKPTIIHAHKLTYEGYIAYRLCKKLNAPLFITLRQTDVMVLYRKPNLIKLYKEILGYSSVVFYINPYTKVVFEKRFGNSFFSNTLKNKMVLLPNIVERTLHKSQVNSTSTKNLLTILRMDKKSVKRKNIKNLLKGFSKINNKDVRLDIIGSGDYIEKIKGWVKFYQVEDKVNFLGSIPNDKIDDYYKNSLAFVLPSFSESFGLVYAESLLNGAPILYSKDCLGFDGFFENVGQAVKPDSIESITQGINDIISNNLFYRQNIQNLQMQNAFDIFSKDYIRNIYMNSLQKLR